MAYCFVHRKSLCLVQVSCFPASCLGIKTELTISKERKSLTSFAICGLTCIALARKRQVCKAHRVQVLFHAKVRHDFDLIVKLNQRFHVSL